MASALRMYTLRKQGFLSQIHCCVPETKSRAKQTVGAQGIIALFVNEGVTKTCCWWKSFFLCLDSFSGVTHSKAWKEGR